MLIIKDLDSSTVVIVILTLVTLLFLHHIAKSYNGTDRLLSNRAIAISFGTIIAINVLGLSSNIESYNSSQHQFISGQFGLIGSFSYHKRKSDYQGNIGCMMPCNPNIDIKYSIYTVNGYKLIPNHLYEIEFLSEYDKNPYKYFEYGPPSDPFSNTFKYHHVINLFDITSNTTMFYEDTTLHIYRILLKSLDLLLTGIVFVTFFKTKHSPSE